MQAVALRSYRYRSLRAFFVRSEVKEHGTKERIEANFKDGDRVIILDDVTTTGGSVLKAVDAVRSRGADVLKVITVVDRQEGAREALKSPGYRVRFVVHQRRASADWPLLMKARRNGSCALHQLGDLV